jgi:hypothetical protein
MSDGVVRWKAVLEIAAEIAREHAAVGRAQRDAFIHARAAGNLLLKIKDSVGRGQFIGFLTQCGDLSIRTAQLYMKVAKHGSMIEATLNAQHVAHCSLRQALRIVGESESEDPGPTRPAKVSWTDVSQPERRELRRIAEELATFPFVKRTLLDAGPGRGGDLDVVAGAAGAGVYWDICGGDPEVGRPTFKYTRTQVSDKLQAFIDTGKRSVVSDLTVDVARRRLKGDSTLQPASLPPSAGDVPTRQTITIDLRMTDDQHVELAGLVAHFYDVEDLLDALRYARIARETAA